MRIAQFITFAAILLVAGYILLNPAKDSKASPAIASPHHPSQATATVESPEIQQATIAKIEREKIIYQPLFSEDLSNQLTPEQLNSSLAITVREVLGLGYNERLNSLNQNFIPKITTENWKEAHAAIGQFPRGSQGFVALRRGRPDALTHIGGLIGKDAVVYLREIKQQEDLEAAVKGWILSDPAAALAWLESEMPPLARAKMWNSHGYNLLYFDNEDWLARGMAIDFFKAVIGTHGIKFAERIYQRMAEDVALEEDSGMAYLSEFASRIAEAKLAQKESAPLFQNIARTLTKLGEEERLQMLQRAFLPLITAENWQDAYAAIIQFQQGTENERKLRKCRAITLNHIGQLVGADAVVSLYSLKKTKDLGPCLEGWILGDPEGALTWLESEVEPLERAKIWNLPKLGLFHDGRDDGSAKRAADAFSANLFGIHDVEVANRVRARMKEDIALGEAADRAHSGNFASRLEEANLPKEMLTTPLAILARNFPDLDWGDREQVFEDSFLPQLTPENWQEAYAAIIQFPNKEGAKAVRKCRPDLLYRIGEIVGKEAIIYLKTLNRPQDVEACLKGWILDDPIAAIAWLNDEVEPSDRAGIWNSHGESLFRDGSEEWLVKQMAKHFFSDLIERHGAKAAEQVYDQMFEDIAREVDPNRAYLSDFANAIAEAKAAQEMNEVAPVVFNDPQAPALVKACHGLALPASALNIQNSGEATIDAPNKGIVTLFEIDSKGLQELLGGLDSFAVERPLEDKGDPTINGWNVWPTTAKTFPPDNPEYAQLKSTWTGEVTALSMISCHSPVGEWLHVEVWKLKGEKYVLKLYTDWE